MGKILIVEDMAETREFLGQLFEDQHEVLALPDGKEIIDHISEFRPSLILMDLMLPSSSGFDLCELIKKTTLTQHIPIFIISGMDNIQDKVHGFQLGADDFISKPFSPVELVARVEAKIANLKQLNDREEVIHYKNIEVRPRYQEVVIEVEEEKKSVFFNPKEFNILHYFIKKHGEVITREEILTHVWPEQVNVSERTIDVYISSIKKKIPQLKGHLKAVYGLGYKLE